MKRNAFRKVQGVAPGRLDFMGGVADYSGSMVLETPTTGTTKVVIAEVPGAGFRLEADGMEVVEVPSSPLKEAVRQKSSEKQWRQLLEKMEAPSWSFYPLGCLLVFARAKKWFPRTGLNFRISSSVPQAMGVSSSAALEVATLRALEKLSGKTCKNTELAHLGQLAENRIVGAPCGLMDQLTCAYGTKGQLLPILCRPDILYPGIKLPAGVVVAGWPSGVKHAVSASPYATARAAAFMGKKIVETHFRGKLGHASELPPSFLYQDGFSILSEEISGKEFLENFKSVDDPLTQIEPQRRYPVRAALRFPVEENFRCSLVLSLLEGIRRENRKDVLTQIGELMLQSHAGYSAMGLGCPETDQMVQALMEAGPAQGIYGARVSGGGSGGTVVVLLEKSVISTLRKISLKVVFSSEGPLDLIF